MSNKTDEQNTTHEDNRLIVEMFRQYFQIHTAIEKTELFFLVLGIIYFLEAILKNTLEMCKGLFVLLLTGLIITCPAQAISRAPIINEIRYPDFDRPRLADFPVTRLPITGHRIITATREPSLGDDYRLGFYTNDIWMFGDLIYVYISTKDGDFRWTPANPLAVEMLLIENGRFTKP